MSNDSDIINFVLTSSLKESENEAINIQGKNN